MCLTSHSHNVFNITLTYNVFNITVTYYVFNITLTYNVFNITLTYNVLNITLTYNFQYQFLRMRVMNWPNIFVGQAQFSVPDFNVQFADHR